jgi:hypothetical protein
MATSHSGCFKRPTARIIEYLDMDLSAGTEFASTTIAPAHESCTRRRASFL